MGTTYYCDFTNNTPNTWTFALYQQLPDSPGLVSVSWKQTTVPQSGNSGLSWEISYLVAIAGYKQTGGKGVYKASQQLPTSLGQAWSAVDQDGVQQLQEAGPTKSGQVLITNNSLQTANLAIGMDGAIAMVKNDVYGGASAQFSATPKYYAFLSNNLVKGEVISGNVTVGPLEVTFPSGITTLEYEAHIDGANIVFSQTAGDTMMVAHRKALAGPQPALALPA